MSLEARGDGGEAVRFEYDAPTSCPTRDAFIAEVRARTSRARLAAEGEPARTFHVTLAWSEAGAEGTLVVTDLTPTTSRRVVDGDSCSAVASALALVAALAIDPSASTGPIQVAVAGAEIPLLPQAVSLLPPPPLPVAPPPSISRPLPKPRIEPLEEARRGALPLDFAAHAALSVFGAGTPLGGVVGSSIGGSIAISRGSWLAPELRLGLSYAGIDSPEQIQNEYAKFTWWRGELEACPVRLAIARSVDLRPCALGRAGALISDGHGATSSLSSTSPWGELGVSALLEWRIVGALAIEMEVGPDFPLVRETYAFQHPFVHVYGAPPVMAEGRLGLAVHFP
jgi:hypothetical protein